ncbi:MAG: hypothetical protein AB1705_03475 [Verrucomicrobiota bacterium]
MTSTSGFGTLARVRLCAQIVFSTLLVLPLCGQDYEIRLFRPTTAGERYRQVTQVEERLEKATIKEGRVIKETNDVFAVYFDATVIIDAVNPKTQASRVSYVIEKVEVTRDGKKLFFLPGGLAVARKFDGQKLVFQIGGKAAEGDVHRALSMVSELKTSESDDDETFGTKSRKKPGDTWKINPRLLKEGDASGFKFDDVDGTVTFSEITRHNGEDMLRISANITGKFVASPEDQKGPDLTSINEWWEGIFPVDATQPVVELSEKTTIFISANVLDKTGEPEVQVRRNYVRTAKTKLARLP